MRFIRISVAAAVAAAVAAPLAAQQQQVKPPIATYGVDVANAHDVDSRHARRRHERHARHARRHGRPAKGAVARPALVAEGLRHAGGAAHDSARAWTWARRCRCWARRRRRAARGERYDEERPPEKPKARMLIYWGCGDAIRPGQPKIADTEKMSTWRNSARRSRDVRRRIAGARSAMRSSCGPTSARSKQVPAEREPARRPARERQCDAGHQVRDRREAGLHAARWK